MFIEPFKKFGINRYFNSILPTSLHKLETLSKLLSINLYCKRDDLTGFAFGGNKTRKLDYLMYDAINKAKADMIIANGALQSNFCRTAAAYAAKYNIESHLFFVGTKPKNLTSNLFLDHFFGSHLHFIDTKDAELVERKSLEFKSKVETNGRKPYFLPRGGSIPQGAIGYAHAFVELMEDCKQQNLEIQKIFVCCGSTGTYSGLLVGQSLIGWPGDVIGISNNKTKEILEAKVLKLATSTAKIVNAQFDQSKINVDEEYRGEGYGINTKESDEALELFAKHEGIMLGDVYTSKAAAGLIGYARSGKISKDENVVFIHTGGNIEIFK